ncbi:MAG: hypothetical protein ABI488_24800 [Polyangiaceae bacterium]
MAHAEPTASAVLSVATVASEPARRARPSTQELERLRDAVNAKPRLRDPHFSLTRALIANLEDTRGTAISADRVQPGDPEIYVDAERDALSVTVEFPSGEMKAASFDSEVRGGLGGWMARFLVAREAPEGDYDALAHIQHQDGSIETRNVHYTVDNTAPELVVTMNRAARQLGMLEVTVTEPGAGRLSDLKRVELMTPNGRVCQLTAVRWGTFRVFIPTGELRGGKLRVVGFDQALNHTVKELELV